MFHPHIHCIVPAGGLTELGGWVHSRKKFFIPVKVLSRKFRGKFLHYLKREKLDFFGKQAYLRNESRLLDLIDNCYRKEWVVYCKPPFKTASCAIEYLGRYTHRVAIANNRILKLEDGLVTFKWRDYRDNNQWKVMTVTAFEFIRRFLLHVLPSGFTKIRHYGFLASRDKIKKLTLGGFLLRLRIIGYSIVGIKTRLILSFQDESRFKICSFSHKLPHIAKPAFRRLVSPRGDNRQGRSVTPPHSPPA